MTKNLLKLYDKEIKFAKKIVKSKPFIGVCGFSFYFLASSVLGHIAGFLNNNGVSKYLIYGFINLFNLMIAMTLIWLLKDLVLSSFKKIKKDHLKLFKKYLPFWFYTLAIMLVVNLVGIFINGEATAANEQAIRSLFNTHPIFIYVAAVFIAPILEELVFRGSLYYLIKNKYIFILISGLSFGLIHVVPQLDSLSALFTIKEVFFVLSYSIPGLVFAYTLYDSKNIFVPMGLHFIHNGIMMLLQVIAALSGASLLIG